MSCFVQMCVAGWRNGDGEMGFMDRCVDGAERGNKKGLIVSLNPCKIHINDPDFYDGLHVGATEGTSDRS